MTACGCTATRHSAWSEVPPGYTTVTSVHLLDLARPVGQGKISPRASQRPPNRGCSARCAPSASAAYPRSPRGLIAANGETGLRKLPPQRPCSGRGGVRRRVGARPIPSRLADRPRHLRRDRRGSRARDRMLRPGARPRSGITFIARDVQLVEFDADDWTDGWWQSLRWKLMKGWSLPDPPR